jgi:Fe-Mn family superoxide dismutase
MSIPQTQIATPAEAAHQSYPFELADLPYACDALEPHFDSRTMQIHHRGHHATYVRKLNEILAKLPELQTLTLAELLSNPARVPAEARTAVKTNGGGHLNHDLFWSGLTPAPAQAPPETLARAINEDFGSFAALREKFSAVANRHFASGWIALALDRASRKLEIVDLEDHDVVPPGAKTALLLLDVWEHAYYLKYQDRRAGFIAAFWSIVNWGQVAARFERALER